MRAALHAVARLLLAVPSMLVVLWASYAIGAGYAGPTIPTPANAVVMFVLVAVVGVSLWHWVRDPIRR